MEWVGSDETLVLPPKVEFHLIRVLIHSPEGNLVQIRVRQAACTKPVEGKMI